jgi:hypothetical protein
LTELERTPLRALTGLERMDFVPSHQRRSERGTFVGAMWWWWWARADGRRGVGGRPARKGRRGGGGRGQEGGDARRGQGVDRLHDSTGGSDADWRQRETMDAKLPKYPFSNKNKKVFPVLSTTYFPVLLSTNIFFTVGLTSLEGS